VVYLDRVETAAPLRFYLHPGSRVPAHCSASGKVFLAQMTPQASASACWPMLPLERLHAATITDLDPLEPKCSGAQGEGYALDDEEFLPGLLCVAVLVPPPTAAVEYCASRSRRR
jgi:IclR family acetate operon transcriptional repressor